CDCRALLHSTCELRRIAVLEAGEPDELNEVHSAFFTLFLGHALPLESVKNIAAHGLPRKQCEVLKDDAAIRPRAGDILSVNQNRPGFDRQKSADEIEQGGFAAAGWPEERDELAIGDLKRNLVERQDIAPTRRMIEMIDTVDDDLCCGSHNG